MSKKGNNSSRQKNHANPPFGMFASKAHIKQTKKRIRRANSK